ncbi:MAG: adenine deaminase C-terminal domain-containing protein [Verrucomicrobiota bacterium]
MKRPQKALRDDISIRQNLVQVALGRMPADHLIRVGRLLEVHTGQWVQEQEIVIAGGRVAYTGPAGSWCGEVESTTDLGPATVVPGFGEPHKHIESTQLTPEFEAALVLPRGNTWTCEAAHEFSNVNGAENVRFWEAARAYGSPLKIFTMPGSATPPTAFETTGGYYGEREIAAFFHNHPDVIALDEVMDWSAVTQPDNPGYQRLWGNIKATMEARGVVEGHGSGLYDPHDLSAFAAAGLSSDHEVREPKEALEKLQRGIFLMLRPMSAGPIIKFLIQAGLKDWSNVAVTTDDRSARDTLKLGSMDYNIRTVIEAGLEPHEAYRLGSYNSARHFRIDPYVGSIAPGRFADLVVLEDLESVNIREVWANGEQVSDGERYLPEIPQIPWPAWATKTVHIKKPLSADDFSIPAPAPNITAAKAAILRPFHWEDDFLTYELPVEEGCVQRDNSRQITKFAMVDRYQGDGALAKMFWLGTGPADPGSALACSIAHDSHNIWCLGSCDNAMALAVNTLREIQGGWCLVRGGQVIASVRLEVGGLMTARPAEVFSEEMDALLEAAKTMQWYSDCEHPYWVEGFPARMIFATLTCTPWRWCLVAPSPACPEGFVNVATGETHPVVWA